jgi:endonuclease YncB( thermonuclease family)
MWEYRAKLIKIVDGDTVERLRLLGVNTPERGDPDWASSTKLLATWFTKWNSGEWPFVVRTQKSDAFGRYLAIVAEPVNGTTVNDYMRLSWPDLTRGYP